MISAREEVEGRYRELRSVELELARRRTEALVEYAIPHERTGQPIRNGHAHRAWGKHFRQNREALLVAPVEHGKSQQTAVAGCLEELGKDPTQRLALVAATEGQSAKLLGQCRAHIERNDRLHEVFPKLRRSSNPKDPWHGTAITVERPTTAKDPSIEAIGAGSAILGSRFDGIIVDDLLNLENTYTPEAQAKLLEWFDSTLYTRLTDGGFLRIIGTPWAPDDLLHTLSLRFPTLWQSAVLNPNDPPDRWIPLWPEQWPLARLLDRMSKMTETAFARAFLCRPRSSSQARFKSEWMTRAYHLGRGRTMMARAPVSPGGRLLPCFTGVDLGVGQKEHHDLSVIFTLALDERQRRIPVEVQSGHWTAPEIVDRIADTQRRFGSKLVVEDNGAQAFILQFLKGRGMVVIPFTTTLGAKMDDDFGIESMAVELRNDQWLFPCAPVWAEATGPKGIEVDAELAAWVREMLLYVPAPNVHTGDRLMASWMALSAARAFLQPRSAHHDSQAR